MYCKRLYLPPPFTLMLWNFLYTFDVQSDIRMMLRENMASLQNLNRGGYSADYQQNSVCVVE